MIQARHDAYACSSVMGFIVGVEARVLTGGVVIETALDVETMGVSLVRKLAEEGGIPAVFDAAATERRGPALTEPTILISKGDVFSATLFGCAEAGSVAARGEEDSLFGEDAPEEPETFCFSWSISCRSYQSWRIVQVKSFEQVRFPACTGVETTTGAHCPDRWRAG